MASDTLGIIIAFVSIILLLSILVTAAVQFIQAALRLRSRNLRKGLADLIKNMDLEAQNNGNEKNGNKVPNKIYMEKASEILNAPAIALINQVHEPESDSWVEKGKYALSRLAGPSISWIDADKLQEAAEPILDRAGDEEGKNAKELAARFKDSEPLLQRRFQLEVRFWTFGVALAAAFLFQVSAPRLLNDLAHDAERRNAIVAGAERLLGSAAEDIRRLDYEDAAIEALQVLQARYPDDRHIIGQASGTGTTRRAIVEELSLALEGRENQKKIVAEYEALLKNLAREQIETAREIATRARTQLEEYGVFLWPKGWGFYFQNGVVEAKALKADAMIGVLITAILLSLGAPFWFEMLRNTARLRDLLSGKSGTSSQPKDEGGSSETDNSTPKR